MSRSAPGRTAGRAVTAVACLALVLAGARAASPAADPAAAAPPPPPDRDPGALAWLAGDAAEAARQLAEARRQLDSLRTNDRALALNHAIALLYAGESAAAEQELEALRAREARWTPALRWLARAREAAASPKAGETLETLLADRGADSRDFLWAGRVLCERGEHAGAAEALRRAVSTEKDLYLGWLWLGDAEEACGRTKAAREAWVRARELHGGGDVLLRLGRSLLQEGLEAEGRELLDAALRTPEGRRREAEIRGLAPDLPPVPPPPAVAPPVHPGERLRYRARYLFIRFATLEVENQGWTEWRGRRAARIVLSVRSNPGFPFLRIDSRFESLVAEDGSVLAHRSTSRDSTQLRRAASYEMDPATGSCTVRHVEEGLFGFDRLPLPPQDQDGVSVLQLARGLARSPASLSVLTAVDSTWKGTQLRTVGSERIKWAGRPIEAVLVEALGHYEGPAGLSGLIRAWVSGDERAVPLRVKIKVALGSVVLDLQPEADDQTD